MLRNQLVLGAIMLMAAVAPIQGQESLNPRIPSIFVIGDSTASNTAPAQQGWGDPFRAYFDSTRINVVNRARAGRSSRTFLSEGLWARVLSDLKPGDFVLIQFGHNDGGPLDTGRARGSLPGTGDETREIIMPGGNRELVHTYGWYLREYIAATKAKGATPIVLSLTVRNIWKDGRVERGSGNFGKWAAEVAQSEHTLFVDVTSIIADRYENLGQESVQKFFPGDHTHTNPTGADFNAAAVVAGLKALPNSPLLPYLAAKNSRIKPPEPVDPKLPSLFLIGDSTVRNGHSAGDETREIENPITNRHEVVHSYGWYPRKYIADSRAKGPAPIVCSLVPRKIWKDGSITRNRRRAPCVIAGLRALVHNPLAPYLSP